MYRHYNANPIDKNTNDCTIRAISNAMDQEWRDVHWDICILANLMYDMPSANEVWWEYLRKKGWKRRFLPGDCPFCYTLNDFCREYPTGTYIVGLDGHVVCVKDGILLDTWDSSDKHPLFYWMKEDDHV